MIRLSEVYDEVVPSLSTLDAVLAVGAGEGAPAVDLGDLVLLHQVVDALGAGVGDLAAALVGRAEGHRGVALDPERLLLVRDDVRDLGVAQQRLGRDAADVEADTAPVLLLDDPDGLAELGGADRGDVPTGAGTEDEDIEVGHVAHTASLVASAGLIAHARTTLPRVTLYAAYGTNLDPAPDERALPALPAVDDGLADRLAAHLRRRGARLGRRPLRRSSGPDRAGLRRGLRRDRARTSPHLDGWEARRLRALPQDQGPGRHPDRRDGRVDLRARRLRGRAALRVVPRRARRRRRGRRRARRLRRCACAACPAGRSGSDAPASVGRERLAGPRGRAP